MLCGKVVERDGDGVVFTPGAGIPTLRIDPDLIGQVISNIVRNARESGATEIVLTTGRNGDTAWFRVRNTGDPIDPDLLSRIFQPFATTKTTGAGVGLALCKKIVTVHGGSIAARNVTDGVEFEVKLPWTS